MLKKLTGPGLFRLFLAELVFVDHVTRFDIGGTAVYVFFCLSGYWIYKMFSGRYIHARQPYLTYAISRLWRLLPTFWLVTVVSLTVLFFLRELGRAWSIVDHFHFLLSTAFIFGYRTLPIRPIGPAWSLDIEMQFYCLAPILALLLMRRKMPPAILLIFTAVLSLGLLFGFHSVSVLSYLPFFAMGMAAAATDWRPSGRFTLASIALIILGTLACLVSPWRGVLLLGSHPGPLSIYNTHAQILLAILAFPYAIYTTRQKGSAFDGIFADLSYIVYLLHYPFIAIPYITNGSVLHKLLFVFLTWIFVSLLSLVVWKFWDHPVNQARSRWVKSRITLPKRVPATPTGNL